MSGDVHVRFREHLRGRFPRVTRLVVLVRSPRAGMRVMRSIRRFLERKLKLTVNEQKSSVTATDRITFLGFAFTKGKIIWSEKSFSKFKHRVRELTGRS